MNPPNQTNIYLERINLVLNHIRQNLTDELTVDVLAEVACFSPFHFHRLFRALTGETLNQCIVRLRLERAIALLKGSPQLSINDAAFAVGFNSASNFSRTFKKRYGVAARQWNRRDSLKELKDRKDGQVLEGLTYYTVDRLSEYENEGEFEVSIRELPQQRLAYIRVYDSYTPTHVLTAYDQLLEWYRQRGDPLTATLYGMSQDDPGITPLKLCRYDIGLTVPPTWKLGDAVSEMIIPTCQFATIHCVGDIYKVDQAWQYLYRYWLPRSRFQPENLPAMEIYHRQPMEIGWEQYDLDCAIPIVSL
ncbi:MAG: AraC family transcriptional regulator [Anaerolineae bacterium]|nr:AraC family transcriptional regulator [Anaerolineae bacterium]